MKHKQYVTMVPIYLILLRIVCLGARARLCVNVFVFLFLFFHFMFNVSRRKCNLNESIKNHLQYYTLGRTLTLTLIRTLESCVQHFNSLIMFAEMFIRWIGIIAVVGFAIIRFLLFFILHACPYSLPPINYFPFVRKLNSVFVDCIVSAIK